MWDNAESERFLCTQGSKISKSPREARPAVALDGRGCPQLAHHISRPPGSAFRCPGQLLGSQGHPGAPSLGTSVPSCSTEAAEIPRGMKAELSPAHHTSSQSDCWASTGGRAFILQRALLTPTDYKSPNNAFPGTSFPLPASSPPSDSPLLTQFPFIIKKKEHSQLHLAQTPRRCTKTSFHICHLPKLVHGPVFWGVPQPHQLFLQPQLFLFAAAVVLKASFHLEWFPISRAMCWLQQPPGGRRQEGAAMAVYVGTKRRFRSLAKKHSSNRPVPFVHFYFFCFDFSLPAARGGGGRLQDGVRPRDCRPRGITRRGRGARGKAGVAISSWWMEILLGEAHLLAAR